MKPPCVTVVKYLLPAIRALVTRELVEKHSITKIEASAKMELTPAAITQYFKGERGSTFAREIEHSDHAMKMIGELAENLAKEDVSPEIIIEKLCEICSAIRYGKVICKLHQEDLPSLKNIGCDACIPQSEA
jgi:predicted transcriptional regulator